MNWNLIEGNWQQLQAVIRRQWGKLTDDDLAVIDGDRDELSGRIQEIYGISPEEADVQIERFAGAIESAMKESTKEEEPRAKGRAPGEGEPH